MLNTGEGVLLGAGATSGSQGMGWEPLDILKTWDLRGQNDFHKSTKTLFALFTLMLSQVYSGFSRRYMTWNMALDRTYEQVKRIPTISTSPDTTRDSQQSKTMILFSLIIFRKNVYLRIKNNLC